MSAEQIRQWIAEGRVNAQTQACAEGTQDWKPLGMFPEFGFTTSPLLGNLPSPETAPLSAEEILARDYTLDILGCLSRGWELFKNNLGVLIVPFLLWAVINFIAGGVMQTVLLGVGVSRLPAAQQQYFGAPMYLILKAVVTAPLTGGLYYIYLSVIRNQPGDAGNLFIGFKSCFSDLFLGKLLTGLAMSLCMLPYSILFAQRLAPLVEGMKQAPPAGNPMDALLKFWSQMFSVFGHTAPIYMACMVPVTYLSVNWLFTLPLIVDKQMDFWTAMKTSWKMVHKHWFHVFGLVVLTGIISTVGGICTCCIGFVATIPFGTAVLMFAYEDIFGRKAA